MPVFSDVVPDSENHRGGTKVNKLGELSLVQQPGDGILTAIQIPEVNGEEGKKEGIPVVDGKKGKGRRVRRKNPRRDSCTAGSTRAHSLYDRTNRPCR